MIHSIMVTNHLGNIIKLDLTRPELSGFIVKSVDGLGPVKGNINTVEVATNDGSVFNSARLGSRNIVLDLVFLEYGTESIEDIRHKSYKYFPVKKKVKLLIETDNRISETEGYIEHNEPTIFSDQEGCQVSIICPYPYFYSAGASNTTVFSGVNSLFEFSFSNESLDESLLIMGEIIPQTEQVVYYNGDAEIGIKIIINATGEASDITILNVDTREIMSINTNKLVSLTGSGIVAGDEITISTLKGDKSITLFRNGTHTNILNCLNKNTDWFQLVKGSNVFAFTAETGTQNLQLRIENRVIYEGV
ncbi:MAG: phage tail family protein [Ruminococcus sp.]|nr:phage tail family protein [Ruminococcus sp.]